MHRTLLLIILGISSVSSLVVIGWLADRFHGHPMFTATLFGFVVVLFVFAVVILQKTGWKLSMYTKQDFTKWNNSATALIQRNPGIVWGIIFILFAIIAFANFLMTGRGFAFFLCTVPWGWFLPETLTTSDNWNTWVYPVSWALIVLNATIIWQLRALWLKHTRSVR